MKQALGHPRSAASPRQKTLLVWAAGVSVLVGIALAYPGSPLVLHIAGYLCASVVTFTCIAFFRRHAQDVRLSLGIALSDREKRVTSIVLIAGLIVSVLQAYLIAVHFG